MGRLAPRGREPGSRSWWLNALPETVEREFLLLLMRRNGPWNTAVPGNGEDDAEDK